MTSSTDTDPPADVGAKLDISPTELIPSLNGGGESSKIWQTLGQRWENSVLQLIVTKARYHPARPYKSPDDVKVSGTGWVVDITKGIIATNAHVVSNAISIIGRVPKLGRRDLTLNLVGICQEKDLALCKIKAEDIALMTKGLSDPTQLNMIIGDDMTLAKADRVMTIGYPMGDENVKLTTGDVSGFKNASGPREHSEERTGSYEDAYDRGPTYIQITAALNGGNSGGPLLNDQGKVVGINAAGIFFSQNIGYSIRIRTFLAIYHAMLQQEVMMVPTMAFDWNKTNESMMVEMCKTPNIQGIYVREVHLDSFLYGQSEGGPGIETGDIITHIEYEDPFWCCPDNFIICDECNPADKDHPFKKVSVVTCYIDRFGDIDIYQLPDRDESQGIPINPPEGAPLLSDRKLDLAEVTDMIPIGAKVRVQVCRQGEWFILISAASYRQTNRLMMIFPRLTPYNYEIFAGICVVDLTLNLAYTLELECLLKSKRKYKKVVVICQVFPDTEAGRTQTLTQGQIITKINQTKVKDVEDIRQILQQQPESLTIETHSHSLFIVSTEKVVPEDLSIMDKFMINKSKYLLGSPQEK